MNKQADVVRAITRLAAFWLPSKAVANARPAEKARAGSGG